MKLSFDRNFLPVPLKMMDFETKHLELPLLVNQDGGQTSLVRILMVLSAGLREAAQAILPPRLRPPYVDKQNQANQAKKCNWSTKPKLGTV